MASGGIDADFEERCGFEEETTDVSEKHRRNGVCNGALASRLTGEVTLAAELPPLRMLLVLDNLAGHKALRSYAG